VEEQLKVNFRLLLVSFSLLLSTSIYAESWNISFQEWSRPRSGEFIVEFPQLRSLMQDLEPEKVITLRFPGGDEGILWAEELKGWLIALGVENSRIELVPGSPVADMITLGIENK
jgi:hypothetical protein